MITIEQRKQELLNKIDELRKEVELIDNENKYLPLVDDVNEDFNTYTICRDVAAIARGLVGVHSPLYGRALWLIPKDGYVWKIINRFNDDFLVCEKQ